MPSLASLFGEDVDVLRDRNFQVLLAANVVSPLGLALLSPVLDSLTGPFDVSAANVGLLMSAFTAPAIVMIPLAGLLSDRYGRKPVILAGLLILGAAGAAISLTTDFRVAIGLRLLQGVGGAALTPIIITSIGDVYEGTREATAQGFRFTGSGLIQMAFPLLAGVLVGLSWTYPFLLYLVAFPIAATVYVWFDEPAPPDATDRDEGGDAPVGSETDSLRDLLGRRRVQAMVSVRGLSGVVWIGFLTYNSIIVVQFIDGTPAQAGLLAATLSLSFAVAATQAGRITSLFDSRLYPLVAANVAVGGGFAAVLFAPALPLATVGTVVSGCGIGVLLSIYRSIITGLAPAELRGTLVSFAEAFGRAVVTLTPVLMGALIAAATPRLGFELAVQAVGLGAILVACGGGILGLLVASNAPQVSHE